MSGESGDERSLFEILGIPRESFLTDPPEDVWAAALAHALDPDSAPVDDTVVPQIDDTVHTANGEDDSWLLDDSNEDGDGGGSHPDLGDFDVFGDFGDTDSKQAKKSLLGYREYDYGNYTLVENDSRTAGVNISDGATGQVSGSYVNMESGLTVDVYGMTDIDAVTNFFRTTGLL